MKPKAKSTHALDKDQLQAIAALQRFWHEPHASAEDTKAAAQVLLDAQEKLAAAKVPQEVISAVIMELLEDARRG